METEECAVLMKCNIKCSHETNKQKWLSKQMYTGEEEKGRAHNGLYMSVDSQILDQIRQNQLYIPPPDMILQNTITF